MSNVRFFAALPFLAIAAAASAGTTIPDAVAEVRP
jgi:hypothetical protein